MSFNTFIQEGVFSVRSGALGSIAVGTIAGDITLWTEYPQKPTYYAIDGGAANRIIILPEILAVTAASDTTKARIGHIVTIKNTGTTNALSLRASDATPVTTILPGRTGDAIAVAAPNVWEELTSGGGIIGGAALSAVGDPNITISGQAIPDVYDPGDPANANITWQANIEDLSNVTEVAPAVGDFLTITSLGVPNQWENVTPTTLTFTGANGITLTPSTGVLPYSPTAGTNVSVQIGNPNALTQLTSTGGVTLGTNPWSSGATTISTNTQTVYNNDPATNLTLNGAGSGPFVIKDGGIVGTLYDINATAGGTQYFRVATDGASLGTNSVAAGTRNIALGVSPAGTLTVNGTNSIVLNATNTGGTITETEKVVAIAPQGTVIANAYTGAGITYSSSTVAKWVADSVTTTGAVAGNFTKTLAIPNDVTYSMMCWLTGVRTNAPVGESWTYRIFIMIKNVGGVVSQYAFNESSIEQPGKSIFPQPLSLSNTNPITFTITPTGLTTEVIRWVMNVEYVRVSHV